MASRMAVIEADAEDTPPSREAMRERYLDEQAAVPDTFWPTSPHGAGGGPDAAGASLHAPDLTCDAAPR